MKKNILFIILLLSCISVVNAQDPDVFFNKSSSFFEAIVSNGRVDYDAISKDPGLLNELIEMTANIRVSIEDPNTFQAFYINAYNLTIIKGIIDHYPIDSPLKVDGFFDKRKHNIAGKKLTLNDIENKMLREEFNDPRFHFVLVCGALGCPPIIDEAYMPETLNAQLDNQTKLALNGDYFIHVNDNKKRVAGSEILKWYKEDFVMNGTEIDFINRYRKIKIPTDYKITYYPYNWTLNKL